MSNVRNYGNNNKIEKIIKEYIKQGKGKLENELQGTREAINMIAMDKTKNFIRTMDKGLDKEEREFLSKLIVSSMYQSFCYGYGIGKMEGDCKSKVFL
jgi:hypothetical protein